MGLSETSHKAASNTNQSQTITHPQQQNQQKSSSPSIEFFQLPKKYQRKPIAIDEMETINVTPLFLVY